MSTRAKMLSLLMDLKDAPRSMVSLVETHDRRTISAAERQGLVMIYAPQMAMITELGQAYLTLEDSYNLEGDPWGPMA